MELEEILNILKGFGGGVRHPHCELYKKGNEFYQPLKPYGFWDFDNEIFYHKPYPKFSCHIPGCERSFETVMEYESHYNSCHSYTCKECKKTLPNSHLLDLHISEAHDSFFMAQTQKKPMYKCFLEECKHCFNNPKERKDHCITVHKFPSNFRFDSSKKIPKDKNRSKKKNVNKLKSEANLEKEMDVVESCEDHIQMNETKETTEIKAFKFKGISFGRGSGRKRPVFYNFSKDLRDSLPQI